MENNENNKEYEVNHETINNENEDNEQPKKFDPAAEAKNKIIFFVVVVALLIAGKYIFNF